MDGLTIRTLSAQLRRAERPALDELTRASGRRPSGPVVMNQAEASMALAAGADVAVRCSRTPSQDPERRGRRLRQPRRVAQDACCGPHVAVRLVASTIKEAHGRGQGAEVKIELLGDLPEFALGPHRSRERVALQTSSSQPHYAAALPPSPPTTAQRSGVQFWEQLGSDGTPSGTVRGVTVPGSTSLTCGNVVRQQLRRVARSVRIEVHFRILGAVVVIRQTL